VGAGFVGDVEGNPSTSWILTAYWVGEYPVVVALAEGGLSALCKESSFCLPFDVHAVPGRYTTPYANTLHRVKRLVHQFVGYLVEFTFDVHKLDRAVLLHEGLHLSTM